MSSEIGKRYLCLWLDNWPIQRLVVEQPELRRQAVVLHTTSAQRGQRVTAVSPVARLAGVRLDMPLSEARSLLRRTASRPQHGPQSRPQSRPLGRQPEASGGATGGVATGGGATGGETYFFQHDLAADRAALQRLAFSCDSFSPFVGLEPERGQFDPPPRGLARVGGKPSAAIGEQPECIVLQVQSVAHLFGGERGLWAAVQRDLRHRGYCVQAALADTFAAARAAAQFLTRPLPADSLVPLDPAMAVQVFGSGKSIPSELHSAPLSALRLHPATVVWLRELGIERIGQLLQIPRCELRVRFGDGILRRLDQISGRLEEVIPWLHEPCEFYAQQFLDFPTTDRATMDVILSRLIGDLCEQLHARGRGGLAWEIRLASPEASPRSFTVQLFQPTAQLRSVLPLVQMKLDQWGIAERSVGGRKPATRTASTCRQDFSSQAFCVHQLSVRVPQSAVLVGQQQWLFDQATRIDQVELAELINRLSTRLGADNVVGAKFRADGLPELAVRYDPLVESSARQFAAAANPGSRSRRGSPAQGRAGRASKPSRPTARAVSVDAEAEVWGREAASSSPAANSPLRRPLRLFPAQEIQVGTAADPASEPQQIDWQGQRCPVQRCWGAERIETGWWRGATVRREYWRVELSDGRWLWIYRDLTNDRWYLQGEF